MFLKSTVYAIIGILCQGALSAQGADWVFRQSWFSDAPAVAYATVYPLVMLLRVFSAQLVVFLLWRSAGV